MADQDHPSHAVDERRKNERIDGHACGARVIDTVTGQMLGIICNLSLGGLMLNSTRELFTDGILQIGISTPPDCTIGDISMGVKVLWCVPANSPDNYWSGLEIIDISESDSAGLTQLLRYLSDTA